MNIKRIILPFIVFVAIGITVSGQTYKEHRGDIFFSRFDYPGAIERYMEAMDKQPENHYVMRKLAESYKYMNNDTASVYWYSKLMDSGNVEAKDLYNYSLVLKNTGEYDKAGDMLKQYAKMKEADNYLLSSDFANKLLRDSLRNKVTLVDQSSKYADFSPSYLGNKIVFVSARQGVDLLHREYVRDSQAFLKLYVADTLLGGQIDNVIPLDNRLNTRYHEGPVCFSEADSTMYFTRNNYKILKGVSSEGEVNLKIYTSKFTYNDWLKKADTFMDSIGIDVTLDKDDWRWVKSFDHNSKEFSTGHPTITENGRIMYFVSDRPGGKGGTDIYKSYRTGENTWSEPENIRSINTEGNEMFPFIHQSGVLFFASDGWPGLGGLDIFKAEPKGSGFEEPVNMGYPINSLEDDFGLIADKETKTGYFASNRPGGKGDDDLYHVLFDNEVKCVLAGIVSEKNTNTVISGAKLDIVEVETGKELSATSNSVGIYSTNIDATKSYSITCSQGMYLPHRSETSISDIELKNDTAYYDIELDYYGIYGSVFIKETNEKVPNVEITCTPKTGGEPIIITSNDAGDFRTLLKRNTDYSLSFNKKDFFALKADYTTVGKKTGWVNINEFITLEIEKIELNKTIEIPNIYYDLGKWNIREDAAVELIKVVYFMNDNPTLTIELGSHTDARGSSTSNQRLSQKRAESAVNWIVKHGIAKERITAKGYGENKIKNRCVDGVRCSEEEHQENRRTEIRITSF